MREIKFRAWSKRDNCWCGAFSVHKSGLFTEMTGARMENGTCVAYADWVDLSKQDEIVLMQYTGLKDKNGKEIYEGDIVTGRNGETKPMKVVWGYHAWGLQYSKTAAPGFYDWNINEVEIIGNIYQNPKLLDNNK
jgi:uncharacterized phage protein (TIGR01671 family)